MKIIENEIEDSQFNNYELITNFSGKRGINEIKFTSGSYLTNYKNFIFCTCMDKEEDVRAFTLIQSIDFNNEDRQPIYSLQFTLDSNTYSVDLNIETAQIMSFNCSDKCFNCYLFGERINEDSK